MKNRLIYVLISLMIISLIGIISIQSIWISGAIATRENEFTTHVNDAMNKVNDDIDQDESKFIIKRQFGGVDSLLQDLVFYDNGNKQTHRAEHKIVINNSNDQDIQIDIENIHSLEESMQNMESKIDQLGENTNEWREIIELKLDNLDSSFDTNSHVRDYKNARAHHITSMVEHFTFEKLLNGDLKNRISNKELKKKLRKALNKEGIHSAIEYAVYNNETKGYEKDYVSNGFDKKKKNQLYSKTLFQNDHLKKSRFKLIVQSNSKGGYIWSGVKEMAILSGIFTILILFSFGYALYFIFKQKKISQIKTDFINNMTHELKTPLASISLASASINHPQVIDKPEEIKKYTTIIDDEKDRINSHIERVLDIATLDKGDLKLDFKTTDLISIIQSSIKNVQLTMNEIEGSCAFKSELDSAPISADEFHLISVITNILDNSIKYHNSSLKIEIELTKSASSYCIKIIDNGIGMTSKEQKQAFDKFYRAETGDIHNRKGFGLGLSYVKGIIEQHDGSVSIQSQKNSGTTLSINIPSRHE